MLNFNEEDKTSYIIIPCDWGRDIDIEGTPYICTEVVYEVIPLHCSNPDLEMKKTTLVLVYQDILPYFPEQCAGSASLSPALLNERHVTTIGILCLITP